jgi:hypothetical protein
MVDTARPGRDYLRAVVVAAQRTGEVVAPWQHVDDTQLPADAERGVLAQLHGEWVRLLVSGLHPGQIVPRRTPAAVRELYAELCDDHPTLRRILDAHATDPELAGPTAREHAMLARVAGLAPDGASAEDAATAGRELIASRMPSQRPLVGIC